MKLKDYYDLPDISDEREPDLDWQQLLSEDPEYAEWLEELNSNFEEVFSEYTTEDSV